MKKYVMVNEKAGLVSILEKETNQIIYKNLTKEVARSKCRSLNSGNGFRGWTPNFMVRKVS